MWLAIAACLVGLGYWNPYSLQREHLKEFIAFKLALLALYAGITTFQWGWWQPHARSFLTQLHDPKMLAGTTEHT